MSNSASNVIPVNVEIVDNTDSFTAIRGRRSQELVIGLCGAMGSGVKSLKSQLILELKSNGYHVEHIRISDLISNQLKVSTTNLSNFQRYNKLQDYGDDLREDKGNFVCAELAIYQIQTLREEIYGTEEESLTKNTKKSAYILDQIKHPAEVELLNEVYKNNFYLLGLLRTETERKLNLKDEGISDSEVNKLIERDRKSTKKSGQQVEEALQFADYFIRNLDTEAIRDSVSRFINLIHGVSHITPTKDEAGMYAAYSASLRSACLSRQVGASITDTLGTVISTGCNDVPSFGGGLYSSESKPDKRCFNKNGCHNDRHKNLLKKEIEKILNDKKVIDSADVAEFIMKNTKAKFLIEYSRAVHAEMDSIISVARNSNLSTIGATLYCTTYPCHNCARHIVAAGIKRVVYIEPYEKSLALQLHDDSICQPDSGESSTKVVFSNFEGVAPKRYAKFFGYSKKRKDSEGKPIVYRIEESYHVDSQYLDSYGDYESRVVKRVKEQYL